MGITGVGRDGTITCVMGLGFRDYAYIYLKSPPDPPSTTNLHC